tara:strand:- start:30 stop:209 length:180 start_codon:yes stop_codon:yes gene_type:complete
MKKYTEEELKFYMDNPLQVELLAKEQGLLQMWNDWCQESDDMTIEEIVEDFFFHFNLVD